MLAGVLLSATLSGLYARGGYAWVLSFVALVPWLRTLDAARTLPRTLLLAYVMTVAFTAAAYAWFGTAIGSYTHVGAGTGMALLLLGAPLFQPQFFAFALVRHFVRRRYGPWLAALSGAAAWVACERLVPRLLGDTYGHGLYPSTLLRQAADVGGAAGLTWALLLVNESIRAAWANRHAGWRAMACPLALAAAVPLLLAGYGMAALSALHTPVAGKPLRMGLVQSNIVDYEEQRLRKGAYAVVREVLDTHFAMSYDAVVRQHADAVLWSETAYPTTFGHPKSAAGAELDRQILGIVNAAGVPFVFGTYDRDAAGEYNATAFVEPRKGLLGLYRKARPFPLTEYVPAWLDGPTFRRWLPWAGTWLPGSGARVFPLRLADGREVPVLPLICLDDIDTGLAIDGARLGAQAILTMSNDSWFTDYPLGAKLHQAAAAFRSIETRLPQFRVTTNGYSGVIDPAGTVIAGARLGERTLVMGALPVSPPKPTLMVAWGDWVGLAGMGFLVALAVVAAFPAIQVPDERDAAASSTSRPSRVAVLTPLARLFAGLLRAFSRTALLVMGVAMLLDDGLRSNTLAQMRAFTAFFLVPEAAARCVLAAFSARASIEPGRLVLTSGSRRLELAVSDIAALRPWRLPVPGTGTSLTLRSGARWPYGLAVARPQALAHAIAQAGGPAVQAGPPSRMDAYARARASIRPGRLNHPLFKFGLLPLALALPAFRLHQHIAYGNGLGEYYTFGLKAYLLTFSLWWAAWIMGVLMSAAALRALIEATALLTAWVIPRWAVHGRHWLERLALMALYLGLPTWLLMRALGV
ncbi:MAG: apolipoprotein N-acyltransferase [Acidobacteriota bacterium]